MKIITLIFTLLFIYSCASNPYKNNAKTLFENQLYPEALIEVEKAIAINANDMELVVLRKKIQEEVFQRELIKIRDIRIGGDVKGAIAELRKLMKNAKSWNIDTNINGMSFQNNEIRNLFNYFEGDINNSLSNDLVLKALYTFDSYQDIFYSMNGNQELSNKINLKGKEKCQKMKKVTLSRNLKYFKSFVNKYCHFFKEEGLSLNDVGLELYNQIVVDENSIGGNVVKRAFFQSPWFNEYSSKQTNSFVKSDFFYDEKNQYKTQIHEYYEKEKYIEQVEKTGFKMVPYQEQEMQCNYIDPYNPCQYVTVSKSRLDTYTYTEPETRYRDVRREYKYSVKETIQMISSSIETNIFLLGSSIKIPYKNYSQYVKLNHNENKPKIGLYPKVEPLYSKDYVIGSEWDIFYNFIQNELDRIWIGTYCGKNSFVNVDFYFSGEAISACLRSKNGYKVDGVEDWFTRNFNLSREIISSYIKYP